MVATFDPALGAGAASFPGLSVYVATASFAIDGHGLFQSTPGADLAVLLLYPPMSPYYGAGIGNQQVERGFIQLFNSTTPPLTETPTPTLFTDYHEANPGPPFTIPLGDGTTLLVINDLGSITPTAEIIAIQGPVTGPEVTVNQASTTTTVNSSTNPCAFGDTVTFTATVTASAASGTVTFKDGTTSLGTGTLSGGTATFATNTLGAGTHSITAAYGGDANYAASTSSPLSQVVSSLVTSNATYARAPKLSLKIRIADIARDVAAQPVTVQSLGSSAQGATLSYNSTFIFYLPAAENNLDDSFTYIVSNGSDTATNTIHVTVASAPGGLAKTLVVSGGQVTVKFFGIPGFTYDIQLTTSMAAPVTWTTVTGTPVMPGANGSFSFTDNSAPDGTAFYRCVQRQ
jgi:hypothetical protein